MASYALEQLYKIGVEQNNHNSLKLFIEMVNGKNPATQVNNYIQINNLQITKEELEQLPNEVTLQIESLISKATNC
ncbi:MAG: hypothetical protein AAFO07_25175 [Bacteroidota bacterium]